MKRLVVCAALVLGVSAGGARDLRDSLWFFADFDSPARLNGHAFLQELDAGGFVEGRYGKGYYFHRPAANLLPPMDSRRMESMGMPSDGASEASCRVVR